MNVKELKHILDFLATDDTELTFSNDGLYLFGIGSVDNKGDIRLESTTPVHLVSTKEIVEYATELMKKEKP